MSPRYEQKVCRVIRSEDTEEWLLLCFFLNSVLRAREKYVKCSSRETLSKK